ncbi:MAG: OmpA family protein [Xanthomonadaceae bacterium]|nr:OmpA family protein [Xanthomonadaceae bacterium]
MTRLRLAFPVLIMLLLGACATQQPTESNMLAQARQAVDEIENNPDVVRHAPVALREAQESLRQAEQSAQQGDDPRATDHYAYLALKRAQTAQAQARREVLAQSVREAEQERARIQLEARERAVARAQREAEESRQALEEAQRQLADLQPQQTERGIVLTLGEVLFPFDSAELQPGAHRALDRLASYLQAHPDHNILVEGHTDATGDADYNQRLSERRAETVYRALVQRGVDPSRLRIAGLGKDFPVADNSTPSGRSQNRRVEVVVAEGNTPPTRREMQQATRPAPAGDVTRQPRG